MFTVNKIDGIESLLKSFKPTHIYYFATPRIRQSNQNYNKVLYEEYLYVYATAFYKLIKIVSKFSSHPFCVFYPSTIFIENEQKGFSEYVNAKKEGEYQCKLLKAEYDHTHIYIKRLPSLKTDQTASLTKGNDKSACDEINNVLAEMRGLVR
jgi:hypothetical protein